MAIQAQNTTLSVSSDGGTTWKLVGNIQSIGDVDFGTKNVITIENIDNENIDKVLGTLQLGALDLSYVYDPGEPEGNGIIKSAFDATTTTKIKVKIELPDSLGTHGTQFEFDAVVPSYKTSGFEKDGFIKSVVSLEQTTKPTITAAA